MIVDTAVYANGRRRGGEVLLREAHAACRLEDHFAWLGLYEPTREEFESVCKEFELHDLAVEDAISAHQRPKLEDYGESLFMVLKTARYSESEESIDLGEIHLFVGTNFVVSVRHGQASELHHVREELERRPELLRLGPGAVLHAIVDSVVDDYEPVIESVQNDIDEVEQGVFEQRETNPAERIYRLKRQVLAFLRATRPLGVPLQQLSETPHPTIQAEARPYFRDVQDHLIRETERIEGLNDLLSSVLQANLTQVTVRQNEDLRKISAAVALVAVPTMIAGVYGMNFEYMPELGWTFGYPFALGLMVVACTLIYRYFRRAGWL